MLNTHLSFEIFLKTRPRPILMEQQAHISLPHSLPTSAYYDCRFSVLRAPLGFQRGAELLEDDDQAIHAWVDDEGQVVSVGRAHLIAPESDGSAADHAGPGATQCPSFGPLTNPDNRPAIQIRQMGTRLEARRKGHAARVLQSLEQAAVSHFGAKVGLLQAREIAIPFYQSQGWILVDEPYSIAGIGPHRSMMKHF
jgi:predicted GNAT family N-acyltransferase